MGAPLPEERSSSNWTHCEEEAARACGEIPDVYKVRHLYVRTGFACKASLRIYGGEGSLRGEVGGGTSRRRKPTHQDLEGQRSTSARPRHLQLFSRPAECAARDRPKPEQNPLHYSEC